MRAATTFAAIAAGTALLLAVAGAGADSEDPGAGDAATDGSRYQLLGGWRLGRASLRFTERRGRVSGRATDSFRLDGCRVRRGTPVFRAFRYEGRQEAVDVWEGRVLAPTRSCRPRYAPSRIVLSSDVGAVERSRRDGRVGERRLRRIRPRVRATDPVLGTWERMGGGVIVELRDGLYAGTAREDFLISNGCRVPAGTVIWRLRPSAPERYDGSTQTFMPQPECEPGDLVRSRWRLEKDADTLVRVASDGTPVEYRRAR